MGYKCNGVLAGISICRKGFPNKTLYPEFKARYNILAAAAVAKAKNDKAAAGVVMDVVKMDKEKYRLGHTKVFFRAGILGKMEEAREDRIGSVLAWLQSGARGKASRSFRTGRWPFTLAREPSECTWLPRLGSGCRSGFPSSPDSSAPSLESSRRNMRIRLPLLRPTLDRPLRPEPRSRLSMTDSWDRRLNCLLP